MHKITQILLVWSCFLLIASCKKEETTQPPSNNAPATPSNPNPADAATNVSRSPVLSWTCSDPDAGDSVKYDIFFASVNPPNTLTAPSWVFPNYSISGLDTNRTYYWRINAKDSKGATSVGPIWRFTTIIRPPTQGLVSYYPFNGNANDESGNGNNGYVNGPTLTTDRFTNSNKAYAFSAARTNYISVAHSSSLTFTNQFTFAVWAYTLSRGNGVESPRMISKGSETISGIEIGFESTLKPFIASHGQGLLVSSRPLQLNRWTHLTGTYDGSRLLLYVNATIDTSLNASGNLPQNTIELNIGRNSTSSNDYFHGTLDDIRIYNRALTPVEIQALYHEGGW